MAFSPVVFNSREQLSADKINQMIDNDTAIYNLAQIATPTKMNEQSAFISPPAAALTQYRTSTYNVGANRMIMISFLLSFSDNTGGVNQYKIYFKVDGTIVGRWDSTLAIFPFENGEGKMLVPNLTEGAHTFELWASVNTFNAGNLMQVDYFIEDIGPNLASL